MENGEKKCLVKANSEILKKSAETLEVKGHGKNVYFGEMSDDIWQRFIKIQ